MTIDRTELKALASDPAVSTRAAFEKLGFNNYATFDYQLKKDPEAQRIWQEGRDAAAGMKAAAKPAQLVVTAPRQQPAKQVRRAPKSKAAKPEKRKATPPPRNGNAKRGISTELLRKLILEFNHIDVYGSVSEHFGELRQEGELKLLR